jgi:hypothetical protein
MKFLALALILAGVSFAWAADSTLPTTGTDRVLQLSGESSYVELPGGIFDGLTEMTIECWVKWEQTTTRGTLFDVVVNGQWCRLTHACPEGRGLMWEVNQAANTQAAVAEAPAVLPPHQWVHLACTINTNGCQLYLNGALVAESFVRPADSLRRFPPENFLGRSRLRVTARPNGPADFQGQMDEIRVWRRARTQAQIREFMFQRITRPEPGLVEVWNFDDASAGALLDPSHSGRMIGNATTVVEELPPTVSPLPWARLALRFKNLENGADDRVIVRAEANGVTVAESDQNLLSLSTNLAQVDLVATSSKGLAGRWPGVQLVPGETRTLDWLLEPARDIAGHVRTMDGKAPLSGVMLELVRVEGTSVLETVPETKSNAPGAELRPGTDLLGLERHVVQLDGTNSYVVLPPGLTTNISAMTVEGWVKWQRFGFFSRFFDFGRIGSAIYVVNLFHRSANLVQQRESRLFGRSGRAARPGIGSLGSHRGGSGSERDEALSRRHFGQPEYQL